MDLSLRLQLSDIYIWWGIKNAGKKIENAMDAPCSVGRGARLLESLEQRRRRYCYQFICHLTIDSRRIQPTFIPRDDAILLRKRMHLEHNTIYNCLRS